MARSRIQILEEQLIKSEKSLKEERSAHVESKKEISELKEEMRQMTVYLQESELARKAAETETHHIKLVQLVRDGLWDNEAGEASETREDTEEDALLDELPAVPKGLAPSQDQRQLKDTKACDADVGIKRSFDDVQ